MEQPQIVRGSLEDVHIPEILLNISIRKETGSLHLKSGKKEKTFYFDEGRVIFAASNDSDDRLGVFLLRRNKINCQQLNRCAAKVETDKRLGSILVLENILQPGDLHQAIVDQLKEIILETFDWTEGTFHFDSGSAVKELITLNLTVPDLILTGVQRIWRWSWIQKGIPAMDAVFRKREGWSPVVRKITLTRDTEAIIDLFDRPRTMDEALQLSPLGNFETSRFIRVLLILHVIEEILIAPQWTGEAPVTAEVPVATQEIPALKPVKSEGPTLKLRLKVEQDTQNMPKSLEPLPDDPVAFQELSFSDFADLTDDGEPQPIKRVESRKEDWESRIHSDLKDFNEVHRYIYEMVALDLGSGAGNFLSRVLKKACAKYPLVFEGAAMNEYGEFDEQALLYNIQGNLATDFSQALDFLVSEERSMIGLFLEKKRVEVIESGLKRIHQRRKLLET